MLIDLGEARPAEVVTTTRPPVPSRAVLAVLSAVLVGLLAGGVHRAPQRPPTILPAALGDATYLSGDRLFVVRAGRQGDRPDVQQREITSYTLPDARPVARTTVAVSGAIGRVIPAGGTILVEYQDDRIIPALVAQAEGTDRALWRRTARLVGASAADGLALIRDDTGMHAVDLTSGEPRWTVRDPRDGFVAEAGGNGDYPRWLVTVTDLGGLETRDARTGERLATVALPAMPGRANAMMMPAGDMLVMRGAGSGYDGYRLPALTRSWHTTADLSASWGLSGCGRLLCALHQQRGVTALDAATGREVWTSERWQFAFTAGGHLLAGEADGDTGRPKLWVIDPATGAPRGDFGRWDELGPPGPDGVLYGKLDVRGQHELLYGVLDPGTRHVRILGSGERVSGGCETSGGALICRLVDASVAVWTLR